MERDIITLKNMPIPLFEKPLNKFIAHGHVDYGVYIYMYNAWEPG